MNTLQHFFAEATTQAAVDLETALLNLPADKRNWSAGGSARTALDMVAECAIMNAMTQRIIETRIFPADFDFAVYTREKAQLTRDWEALRALLQANTARAVEAIGTVPDEALGAQVQGVPGAKTLVEVVAYAYWNMKYHEGQINFIAALLDI